MSGPITCAVCNRRVAVFRRKKGDKEPVCATCMVACRAVFGDKSSDFKKIKYDTN